MEINTAALALFIAPYLKIAGQKIAEKTVEALFEARGDLARKFTGLFKEEIISLGLNDSGSTSEMAIRLDATPGVKEAIGKKVADNQNLLEELASALSRQENREIHTTNYFENVETVHIDQRHS